MKRKVLNFIILLIMSILTCNGKSICQNQITNQEGERFSREDTAFLQTFIIHKKNVPPKVLFDKLIYSIAKNTQNTNYLNNKNTKRKITTRKINNKKAYLYKISYKKVPPLEQKRLYVVFFTDSLECYIFYFQKLLLNGDKIRLWFNIRGKLTVTQINFEELKTIISIG